MELRELSASIANFSVWSHADKIKLFAWYLHTYKDKDRFTQGDLRACYDELHLDKPSNVSPYLSGLVNRKPREVIRDNRGFYLVGQLRADFDTKYGQRRATVQIAKLLADLPGKVSSEAESRFLSEALVCFHNQAFRAAIILSWILAYDHLLDWIIANHLPAFNARISVNYPKKSTKVSTKEDFETLKESEVIEICGSANLISGNTKKILTEKLNRRNMAAHPSTIEITQFQVEDCISDLVNNVILKLA